MLTLVTIAFSGAFFGFLGYWMGHINCSTEIESRIRIEYKSNVYERVKNREIDEFEIVLN